MLLSRDARNVLMAIGLIVSLVAIFAHNQVAIWLWTKFGYPGFLISAAGYTVLGLFWFWRFYVKRDVVSRRRQNWGGILIFSVFPWLFAALDVLGALKFSH